MKIYKYIHHFSVSITFKWRNVWIRIIKFRSENSLYIIVI